MKQISLRLFSELLTSQDAGTMRSWVERSGIGRDVLPPDSMYMLEVIFAQVTGERQEAILQMIGPNLDPKYIGALVAATIARLENHGRVAAQVGLYSREQTAEGSL